MLFRKLTFIHFIFLVMVGCTPQTEKLFSSLRPGEIAALSNTTLDAVASDYNFPISILASAGSSMTTVDDTLGKANPLEAKLTFSFPSIDANTSSLSFVEGQNQALYASGVLPGELFEQFSFFSVIRLVSASGQIMIYDTNDTNDLAAVSVSGTQLILKHQTSDGNYRARLYDVSPYVDQWHVYAFAFGNEGKDINLYIDGYRQTDYSSISVGSSGALTKVQRHLTIGGTSHATFKMKHFSIVGEKIDPYQMFQVGKYLGQYYGIAVSDSVTKEIRNDLSPAIEPENIDYTFLASAILKNKCAGCHQPGEKSPYLNTYANLMAAVNDSGDPVVTPGDIANSRLYQTVLANEMPAGGATPLNDTEKNYIKTWIENGAID